MLLALWPAADDAPIVLPTIVLELDEAAEVGIELDEAAEVSLYLSEEEES